MIAALNRKLPGICYRRPARRTWICIRHLLRECAAIIPADRALVEKPHRLPGRAVAGRSEHTGGNLEIIILRRRREVDEGLKAAGREAGQRVAGNDIIVVAAAVVRQPGQRAAARRRALRYGRWQEIDRRLVAVGRTAENRRHAGCARFLRKAEDAEREKKGDEA